MIDEIERLLKQPLPASYDALAKERERVWEALVQVYAHMNRISRDLDVNVLPTARTCRDERWLTNARHARRCLSLTAERLKERLRQISRATRGYALHKFIVEARRLLPDDTFNSIMNATRRRQSRRDAA